MYLYRYKNVRRFAPVANLMKQILKNQAMLRPAAASSAARVSVDLVLMDLQMPGMDGIETTRRLREDPALADLPVIAMTASAMAGDRERLLQAGMNDYVAKPVRVAALYSTLGKWLKK